MSCRAKLTPYLILMVVVTGSRVSNLYFWVQVSLRLVKIRVLSYEKIFLSILYEEFYFRNLHFNHLKSRFYLSTRLLLICSIFILCSFLYVLSFINLSFWYRCCKYGGVSFWHWNDKFFALCINLVIYVLYDNLFL